MRKEKNGPRSVLRGNRHVIQKYKERATLWRRDIEYNPFINQEENRCREKVENTVKVKKVLSPRYNKSIARINTLSYGGNKLSQVTLAVRKFGKAVSLSSFPPEGRGEMYSP